MQTHGPLTIHTFVDPMYQENGLVMLCDDEAWVLDPGFDPQAAEMLGLLRELEITPSAIMLTHCHPDHIAGVGEIKEAYPNVPIRCPRDEAELLTSARQNLSEFMGMPVVGPPADELFDAGETFRLGSLEWSTLDVRGHSPGGVAFYCAEVGVVIAGDALFAGSIGRFDFPHSSRTDLLRNIERNLLTLPPETVLYAGHGPSSTIGHEKQHNMVLRMELER
jgi:glyoxylase-like metal-dependent hydrolase (beta-lactamase superfamily II)